MTTDLSDLLDDPAPAPPRHRMIRIDEVMRITSMSRPTIYRMMQSNGFPQQRRLSHKVAVWLESEVMRWIDEQLGLLV